MDTNRQIIYLVMIVMPSNNTGFAAGFLFGKHPGRLGHLHSVESPREPVQGIPWAMDNGVFGAWSSGKQWSEEPLYRYLDEYAAWKPLWVVVPDWVGDRDETLRRWDQHAPALQSFGVPLAMATLMSIAVHVFDALLGARSSVRRPTCITPSISIGGVGKSAAISCACVMMAGKLFSDFTRSPCSRSSAPTMPSSLPSPSPA